MRNKFCIIVSVVITLLTIAALFIMIKSIKGDVKGLETELKAERTQNIKLIKNLTKNTTSTSDNSINLDLNVSKNIKYTPNKTNTT